MTKKIFMALALVMSMAVTAFAGPREEVEEMVAQMQEECPMAMDDDAIIENVFMDGDNVIYIMTMPIPAEIMSEMKSMIPMLKGELIKGMKQDPNAKNLIKKIKDMGGNLILSLKSTVADCDPVVITFTNKEL